jgi:GNAT superfamily N-acetyltransferase
MAAAMKDGYMVTFLVEADATIVGEVTLAFREDRAALAMVIEAGHRGKGYSRALLLHAIHNGRERGVKRIELAVYTHNAPAIKLYRSVGFIESGPPTPETRSDGQRWDAIPMGG